MVIYKEMDAFLIASLETVMREAAYLTMWLLSDNICRREISRKVVDGTPSSSICKTQCK